MAEFYSARGWEIPPLPWTNLSPPFSVLLAQLYMRMFTPESHLSARNCLEAAVVREPEYADAWAWLGHLYDDSYGLEFNPIPSPLDKARAALEKALSLSPRNQKARWELAAHRFFRQDINGFSEAVDQALSINPNNAQAKGDIANFLALAGFDDKAFALAEDAQQLNPVPTWGAQFAFYIVHFRQQDYRQSLTEISKVPLVDFYWYQSHLAAVYGHLGETVRAQEAAAKLRALYPEFAANSRELLGFWFWTGDDAFVQDYIDGLRKAGLDIPDTSVRLKIE